MELLVFQEDKAYIQQCLENGEVDYVEAASEASETEFFKYLNGRGLLQQLSETYPLRRKKQEVPMWLYVASDISLRLHGMQSFHGYPLVVRTGGLINALGPKVGKKTMHPKTGQMTLHCPGFNSKNRYDRQTPCDQDWLRKVARATPADKLQRWYNTQMPQLLKEQKLFDLEGIFIGDASYVFVPDNENYEGSVVLLFDEHNHPVNKEALTSEQLRRCSYKRCYKWVELIHVNRKEEFYFFVAMHLGSGKEHESPILYKLVEDFLQIMGRGIMKWLVVDRGFLDGQQMGHLKKQWGVDTLTGLRSNMAILEDARGLLRIGKASWQSYQPAELQSVTLPPEPKPEVIVKREKARQRTLRAQGHWPEPPQPEKIAVFNGLTSWDACSVPLTVVLTERDAKPPWGLVTTAHTRDGSLLRDTYHLRQSIEERHRQTKLFWDLTGFHSPNFNLVTNQVVFVGLAYTLLQIQLLDENRPELNRMTRTSLKGQLLPYGNHVVVYYKQYFAFFNIPQYTGIIMDIVEPAKSKLRKKMRKLEREFLHSLKNPRPP
ncbi:MAG: transposase [Nitrospirota bacterium]